MREHASEFINARLHTVIRNGDSVKQVSLHLGVEGLNIDTDSEPEFYPREVAERIYARCPSGVISTDKFFYFSLKRSGVVLQFRDGELINHDPTKFTNVGSPFSVKRVLASPVGRNFSQFGRRMDRFHCLAGLVGASALFAALLMAKRRGYSKFALKSMITLPVAFCAAILCVAVGPQPAFLGWFIVGFIGLVAWHVAGQATEIGSEPAKPRKV